MINPKYEVVDNTIVKTYEDGNKENLCLLEDVNIVVDRTRETLDRIEDRLKPFIENENSVLSYMFSDYVNELNELKKISLTQ